jgi:hypothetical protein
MFCSEGFKIEKLGSRQNINIKFYNSVGSDVQIIVVLVDRDCLWFANKLCIIFLCQL